MKKAVFHLKAAFFIIKGEGIDGYITKSEYKNIIIELPVNNQTFDKQANCKYSTDLENNYVQHNKVKS